VLNPELDRRIADEFAASRAQTPGDIERTLLVENVLDDLQRELRNHLIGAVLCGSYAYGVPRPNSDLDIQVVLGTRWRQRRCFRVRGVLVDMWLRPPDVLRRELDAEDRALATMLAYGQILMDRDGLVQRLASEAKQIVRSPLPWLDPGKWPNVRQGSLALLGAARDAGELDPLSAVYTMFGALHQILYVHSRLQRRTFGKLPHHIRNLAAVDPAMHGMVARVLSSDLSSRDRLGALRGIHVRVLGPEETWYADWRSTALES